MVAKQGHRYQSREPVHTSQTSFFLNPINQKQTSNSPKSKLKKSFVDCSSRSNGFDLVWPSLTTTHSNPTNRRVLHKSLNPLLQCLLLYHHQSLHLHRFQRVQLRFGWDFREKFS
ncbi:hypothetical protein Pint_25809 [Pistacia integerrima]|uniref:Uncharacterized protein n=1 Tax=Pistacia integerrima TaxID=434235 RepID=A0ACC0YEX0_9ROSI|nr:hypothetical protein Pint_25809 [Pistacia integerrima]